MYIYGHGKWIFDGIAALIGAVMYIVLEPIFQFINRRKK